MSTTDQVQDYILTYHRRGDRVVPAMRCTDGFKMSVQAGEYHYCEPRDNYGPWVSFEVGFPTMIEPLLWKYAQEPGSWTDTVYSYVPAEVVAAVIDVHGGLDHK